MGAGALFLIRGAVERAAAIVGERGCSGRRRYTAGMKARVELLDVGKNSIGFLAEAVIRSDD